MDTKILNIQSSIENIHNNDDLTTQKASFSTLSRYKNQMLKYCIVQGDEICENNICHYTNIDTFPKLINKESKFRLYNAQYLNDPEEGMLLIHLIKDDITYNENPIYKDFFDLYDNPIFKKSDTYIASFTYEKDFLPMWSMYGNDGKGVCCEIDIQQFSLNYIDEQKADNKAPKLYKVKYLDKYGSSKEKEFVDDSIMKIKNELIRIFAKIIEMPEDERLRNIRKLSKIIDELRFLFKDKSYSYENECRVVISSEKAKIDNLNNKFYIELPLDIIHKDIVIGPKCGQVAVFAQLALHSEKVEDVHMSTINYQ